MGREMDVSDIQVFTEILFRILQRRIFIKRCNIITSISRPSMDQYSFLLVFAKKGGRGMVLWKTLWKNL